jgi:glycosyltransferase involved in cell wall biosynthesis
MEHAVDPSVFSHLPKDSRVATRKTMNIPSDAIVFLNANRNSQRKRLDLSVMGFVQLLKRNPESQYYFLFVTNMNPQSGAYYDLQRVFLEELKANDMDRDKFVQRLMIMDTAPPNNVADDAINRIYNATDIGVNTSDGEGYGLCQLEHLYTGAPQVVTDVGSYRSFLTDEVAEFIPTGERVYFPGTMPLGFYTPGFAAGDVATAFENAIKTLDQKKKAALEFRFKSWSTVCDGWLDDIIQA